MKFLKPLTLILIWFSFTLPAKAMDNVKENAFIYKNMLIEELEILANHQNPQAQFELGTLYLHGESGISQDDKQAFYLFKTSAEQGNPYAQFNLGYMYANGLGTEIDYEQAIKYYKLVVDVLPRAATTIAYFYAKGKGVEKNLDLAFEWTQKAANMGERVAQHNLAFEYSIGRNVEKNYELAHQLFRKSAEQGYQPAQYRLSLDYALGDRVEKDCEQAFYWLFEAYRNKDNPEAY